LSSLAFAYTKRIDRVCRKQALRPGGSSGAVLSDWTGAAGAAAGSTNTGSGATYSALSITPTYANDVVICCVGCVSNAAAGTPSGFTVLGGAASSGGSFDSFYKSLSSGAATGNVSGSLFPSTNFGAVLLDVHD
jgi:hypothetical protein